MNARARLKAALSGAAMDRVPMIEIGFWPETLARWHEEGMPENIDPYDYFGLDKIGFFTVDGSLQLPIRVEREDENERVATDDNGLLMRSFKGVSAPPQVLSAALSEPGDWEKYRHQLAASPSRLTPLRFEPVTGKPTGCRSQRAYYDKCVAQDTFTIFTPIEPMWFYLRLMLEDESLMGIASDPDGVERIIADYSRFNEDMLKLLYQGGMRFDAVWVFSDLCYKNGMLFSPRFYRERVLPYVKSYIDLCHEMGAKFIYHSDGNLADLLPLLFEAGIDCMQPLEARAGNDVVRLAEQYRGALSFIGNINADVLSTSKDAIEREVSRKVLAAKRHNRYIFHSDHSVPPMVSLENYRYALEIARRDGAY